MVGQLPTQPAHTNLMHGKEQQCILNPNNNWTQCMERHQDF